MAGSLCCLLVDFLCALPSVLRARLLDGWEGTVVSCSDSVREARSLLAAIMPTGCVAMKAGARVYMRLAVKKKCWLDVVRKFPSRGLTSRAQGSWTTLLKGLGFQAAPPPPPTYPSNYFWCRNRILFFYFSFRTACLLSTFMCTSSCTLYKLLFISNITLLLRFLASFFAYLG